MKAAEASAASLNSTEVSQLQAISSGPFSRILTYFSQDFLSILLTSDLDKTVFLGNAPRRPQSGRISYDEGVLRVLCTIDN